MPLLAPGPGRCSTVSKTTPTDPRAKHDKKPVDLAGVAVTLQAGQELVFVPKIGRHHTASTFTLRDLTVTASAPL